MSEKSEYVMSMLEENVKYRVGTISALKAFKRVHKTERPGMTFEEIMDERLKGMQELAKAFAEAYNVPVPVVRAQNIRPDGLSTISNYCPATRTITMVGKLSIITFLHEFAHHLYIFSGEHKARVWSINLFKRVYPKAFDKLRMANDFVLVK
jgi:hypothetical protein